VDEKTYALLVALREQVPWAPERSGGDSLNVNAWDAAVTVGMEPGSTEHCLRIDDLVSGGYLTPHPRPIFRRQWVYQITLQGIATAEAG
jgi:hypothetical protein